LPAWCGLDRSPMNLEPFPGTANVMPPSGDV
jgi:hypothetical protein